MAGSAEYVPVWKLREIIGVEAAEKLLDARGGDKVFVNGNPSPRSKVAQIIGIEAARRLSDHFRIGYGKGGGVLIELPRGGYSSIARWSRKMEDLIDQGVTDAEIIAETGVNSRTIRRWRARLGKPKLTKSGPTNPQLVPLLREGKLTNNQIALELDMSPNTIARWRRRLKSAADFELANELPRKSWPPQISYRKAG